MISRERFCDLIHMHERGMYAFALSILKDPDDAADCVQEAILKAYSRIDTLRDADKFKPWIMTVVHRTGISMLRGRKEHMVLDEMADIPYEERDAAENISVSDAVASLDEPYRTVVRLFYYGDLSVKQISRETAATESAVRTQLVRARKMLAKLLDKENLI